MQSLIIKRKEWLRGEGPTNSRLLRSEDNKRCCLGSYAEQIAKLAPEFFMDVQQPALLGNAMRKLVERAAHGIVCNDVCILLMEVNDDRRLSDKAREERLTELFKQIEIEVEFIN